MVEFHDNYAAQCEEWRKKFLDMDQIDIVRRVPEIERGEETLGIWHFGRHLIVSRSTGEITCDSDDLPVPYTPKLNVYTLFWYCKPTARMAGDWVAFSNLRDAANFAPAFKKMIIDSLAATFSGHEDSLEPAVKKIRGKRVSSNVYELRAFQCIPMRVCFWDGDEEFPASANILFDSSAVDFIHVESVVTIAVEGIRQLARAAGLEIKNWTLPPGI
ncbi:MAG: DUF3786 domain-containing protein [Coriobacteriales bacterium]